MSSLTLRPNADGSKLEWDCSSGLTHYVLIDEAVADDADYIYRSLFSGSVYSDYFAFPDHTTEDGIISNITLCGRLKTNHSSTWTMVMGVVIGGTEYRTNINGVTNSFADYSLTLTTNPATSAAWSWSDIDSLVGLISASFGELSINGYCSQFYIVVNYINTRIDSFTADPESLVYGDPVTLTWTTTDATTASISPTVGSTTVDGTVDLYPTETTIYTLSATGEDGTVTDTVTVTILDPVIDSFTATPEIINFGNSSILSWGTTGAATVTLSQGIGVVGTDGAKKVQPTETTSYTLSATNPSATVYDYVSVTVTPIDTSYLSAQKALESDPDYGRLPQMSPAKKYLEFSSDITSHYVESIGFDFPAGDFKRPYLSENYNSMVYLFDDTPSEVSVSIKETQISKVLGETPNRNDMYFDFSPQLASLENFNSYARENYRLMGKTPPTASMSFSGVIESIESDVGNSIPGGSRANLSVVSPKYSGDKYIWTGRVKEGVGDWGSLSRSTGLTTIYRSPELTANTRAVIIALISGGTTLAEYEFTVWFQG